MFIPQGTIDTHAHVFEPSLGMESGRRYTPTYSALLEDYLSRLDAFGIEHGVLVQPSFLGTDNDYLVDALRASAGRCKGVAVVDPGVTAAHLCELKQAGIEGIRLNLFGRALPDLTGAEWGRLLKEVSRLDWHVEVHCPWMQLPQVLPALSEAGCRVVVDHLGRPDFAQGTDLAQMDFLCRHAETTPTWVKLSAPYRLWPIPDPDGYDSAVRWLLDRLGPERLMWGSDWPHTQHETIASLSDGLSLLMHAVPDEATLERILVRTPKLFFKF